MTDKDVTQEKVRVTAEIEGAENEYHFDGVVIIGCSVVDGQEHYKFDFVANMPLEIGLVALQDVILANTEKDGTPKLISPDGDNH